MLKLQLRQIKISKFSLIFNFFFQVNKSKISLKYLPFYVIRRRIKGHLWQARDRISSTLKKSKGRDRPVRYSSPLRVADLSAFIAKPQLYHFTSTFITRIFGWRWFPENWDTKSVASGPWDSKPRDWRPQAVSKRIDHWLLSLVRVRNQSGAVIFAGAWNGDWHFAGGRL